MRPRVVITTFIGAALVFAAAVVTTPYEAFIAMANGTRPPIQQRSSGLKAHARGAGARAVRSGSRRI